ncbi:unnamed protein product [Effrenium voratum]|nr:unnamed protein product [Effrenium voratum]
MRGCTCRSRSSCASPISLALQAHRLGHVKDASCRSSATARPVQRMHQSQKHVIS